MSLRNVGRVAFVAVVIVLFVVSLRIPTREAEATAALAAVDACTTGDAVAAHQSGEHEPGRLPVHTWIVSAVGTCSRTG